MHRALRICAATVLLVPGPAQSTTLCERYEEELRRLADEGTVALIPLMSQPSGALDKSAPYEIGCQVRVTPSDRTVILQINRENSAAGAARATRDAHVGGGVKPAPKPEPSLGSEGFSILAAIGERTLNYLIVVGHTDKAVVNLTIQRGAYSRARLTDTELDRGRSLVATILADIR